MTGKRVADDMIAFSLILKLQEAKKNLASKALPYSCRAISLQSDRWAVPNSLGNPLACKD